MPTLTPLLRTVPGNVVIDLAEFHLDPQVQHNNLVVEHEVGVLGAIRETRTAPLMSETPLRVGGFWGPAALLWTQLQATRCCRCPQRSSGRQRQQRMQAADMHW